MDDTDKMLGIAEEGEEGEEEDEFAEVDLPDFAKSYVISRVTNKDKEDRSRKSRMSRMSGHHPQPSALLKRSVDDEFKLSMIKATLDYDIGNFQGRFESDVRARNTSKVLPGQEWAVDRRALERAKMNSMADVLLPPPSPDMSTATSRRKNAMVLPVPNNLTASLANLQGLHQVAARSPSPTRSTSRLSNAPLSRVRSRMNNNTAPSAGGILAEIERRMTSKKGKLEAAASLVPCTGSGSLRSYINYVTAESDNFVPDPILDPEKGVEYGIFAEGDDGRELTQAEIEYNEQQAALAKLKERYGEKEFDRDARKIEKQFEAIVRQFESHQEDIDRSKWREKPIRLMRELREVPEVVEEQEDVAASEISSERSRKSKKKSRKESANLMDMFGDVGPSDKRQKRKQKKASNDLFDDLFDKPSIRLQRGKKKAQDDLLEDSSTEASTEDDSLDSMEFDRQWMPVSGDDKSTSSYTASLLAQSFAVPQDGTANLNMFLDPMADLAKKHPTLAKLIKKEEEKKKERSLQEQQARAERGRYDMPRCNEFELMTTNVFLCQIGGGLREVPQFILYCL